MSKKPTNIEEFLNYISKQAENAVKQNETVQQNEEDFPSLDQLAEMLEENHEHFIGINIDANGNISTEEICGYTPIQEVSDYDILFTKEQARDLLIELAKILV